MTDRFPLQIVSVDEPAHAAVEMAELEHFDEISKADLPRLSAVLNDETHPIVVLSQLDTENVQYLMAGLEGTVEPIVILPQSYKETEALKSLVLHGVRIILANSETLITVSLADTLRQLETLFYDSGTDQDIALNFRDIYEVMGKGTLCKFYKSKGSRLDTVTLNALNVPESFEDIIGIVVIYRMHEEISLLEVAESMDILEAKVGEESSILFGTRNTMSRKDQVEVSCLVSRKYDFISSLHKRIKHSESYMDKVRTIVNAFYEGEIDADEAEILALQNDLNMKDLNAYYDLAYAQPRETVRLIEFLQNQGHSAIQKEEALADAVIQQKIHIDIAEALIQPFGLSVDSILKIIDLKKEGKLFLFEENMPEVLKKNYPNLLLARVGEQEALIENEVVEQFDEGIYLVDTMQLSEYEKDGKIWLVSWRLSADEIERFVKEHVQ